MVGITRDFVFWIQLDLFYRKQVKIQNIENNLQVMYSGLLVQQRYCDRHEDTD